MPSITCWKWCGTQTGTGGAKENILRMNGSDGVAHGNKQSYCFIVLSLADVIFMFIFTVILHLLHKLLLLGLLLLVQTKRPQ